MQIYGKISLCALIALIFAGCGSSADRTGDVNQSPEMNAALTAERRGDYDKAIAYYYEAIAAYPKAATPYLQIALILQDKKKDYIGAIYNYRRYTELANPNKDASNLSVISDRIRAAGQLLAAQYVSTISAGSSNDYVKLMENFDKLNKKLSAIEAEKQTCLSSNQVLRAKIAELDRRIEHQNDFIQRLRSSSAGGTGGSTAKDFFKYETITNSDGTSTTVQTYEVQPGDTLSHIAELVYRDAKKWKKIKDANKDIIKDDRVRPGDVLRIPDDYDY